MAGLKKVIFSGDALVSVSLKEKYDGKIDYATIKINGVTLDEILGAALCRGKEANVGGYIETESVARVSIEVTPVEPMRMQVLERVKSGNDTWRCLPEPKVVEEPEPEPEAKEPDEPEPDEG